MKQIFEKKDNSLIYRVPCQNGPVNGIVQVPGSKSITNRALLLAALSAQTCQLNGVLFSDDSRHFLDCLLSLGFDIVIDEEHKKVTITGTAGCIPNKTGTIHVGSAGTAARFLTAMLALSDGVYQINCSTQMEKRPMMPLFEALEGMGASFQYLKEPGYLPVIVTGNAGKCRDISMDISKSTQFLSALLMVAPTTDNGLRIHISSEKKDGSYIRITREMLKQFSVTTRFDGTVYEIPGRQNIKIDNYIIEPDISAACYFYAIAALTGGSIVVKNVMPESMQGDLKFLSVLEKLNCRKTVTAEGIQITGPENGIYPGVDVDMNDFSDQTMTMAALAAYATSDTIIRNVGHIRLQECNRMQAIVNELNRAGVACRVEADNIIIHPGWIHKASLKTYEDHRVAMALTLLGLRTEGIVIEDPLCCKKTFENYYEVLEELLET